jgi:hypothetical protein
MVPSSKQPLGDGDERERDHEHGPGGCDTFVSLFYRWNLRDIRA